MILGKSESQKSKERAELLLSREAAIREKLARILSRTYYAWYPRKLSCGRWIWLERYQPEVRVYNGWTGRDSYYFTSVKFVKQKGVMGPIGLSVLAKESPFWVFYKVRAHKPVERI